MNTPSISYITIRTSIKERKTNKDLT
jgi:hypothetical protein